MFPLVVVLMLHVCTRTASVYGFHLKSAHEVIRPRALTVQSPWSAAHLAEHPGNPERALLAQVNDRQDREEGKGPAQLREA
jgi:hypothetical protein